MNRTTQLHALGQRLWLDSISRQILDDGTLSRYIADYSLTGLTSNPSIFDQAIGGSGDYDRSIVERADASRSDEALFMELALEDLRRAADLFRRVFDATAGIDGWVSMEVSPLLADDAQGTMRAANDIHEQAARPNLFVKIPGTPAGLLAIEESIFAGVPINVTLLFSLGQYLAAAEAYQRGIERRIAAGRDPRVDSVASLFVSRWDTAVVDQAPPELRNRLGIAIAGRCYRAYRELLASPRWEKLAAVGALPQRLLWASTGTKDPQASETLYVDALIAPDTINTVPQKTLEAFAQHGETRATLNPDGREADAILARFAQAGIDVEALGLKLQRDGTQAFADSWHALLQRIADKRGQLPRGDA